MEARMLLSSPLPLGVDVCPHSFLDEFVGLFVLGDFEQLHGLALIGGKPHTSWIIFLTNLVYLVR